jgi:glycogen(starch) synthase
MHVLLLSYFYPPASGGEGTYTAELAEGLQAAGHLVTVLACGSPEVTAASHPAWVYLISKPDECNRFAQFEQYRERYARSACELALQVAGDSPYDVIHVQDWFSAEAALQLARRYGIPCVKTLHYLPRQAVAGQDMRGPLHEPVHFHYPSQASADQWQQRLCHEADATIAVSEYMRDAAIVQYRAPAHKLHVVHNGVRDKALQSAPSRSALAANPSYAFLHDRAVRVVLLSGRLTWQKGIDLLLRSIPPVAQRFPDVRWVICGGGAFSADTLEEYRPLTKGYDERVVFTGHVTRDEALGWTSLAEVVVAPSRFEPFGLSVLEAMLLGKPVIVAGVDGLSKLVEHNQSGIKLLPATTSTGSREVSPAALAEAQIQVLTDGCLAKSLGDTARARAEQQFSFERFVQGTLDVYQHARSTST